jgi:hypothetical protein
MSNDSEFIARLRDVASADWGGGVYGQLATFGIAIGLNPDGDWSATIFDNLNAGVSVTGGFAIDTNNSWPWDWEGSFVAGAGIGTVTGVPGPSATLWYDFISGNLNASVGGGITDILEGGFYAEGRPGIDLSSLSDGYSGIHGNPSAGGSGLADGYSGKHGNPSGGNSVGDGFGGADSGSTSTGRTDRPADVGGTPGVGHSG